MVTDPHVWAGDHGVFVFPHQTPTQADRHQSDKEKHMAPSKSVTLVHETRKPHSVTVSNPTTITQLKSQGYRVAEPGTPEAENTGYAALSSKDLRAEIKTRNESRAEEDQIRPEGRKNTDLVAALEADDTWQEKAAREAADNTGSEGSEGAESGEGSEQ